MAARGIAGSTFDHVVREAGVSGEVRGQLAELARSTRLRLADARRAGRRSGVFELRAEPDDVASFLFALAHGVPSGVCRSQISTCGC